MLLVTLAVTNLLIGTLPKNTTLLLPVPAPPPAGASKALVCPGLPATREVCRATLTLPVTLAAI